MTAASGADRICSNGPGDCGGDPTCPVDCPPASGADQPTLRDQLAEAVPHADWCHERDRELGGPCVCHHDRLNTADALLPVIEAHTKRAKAEAAAEALERAASDVRWQVPGFIGRIDLADALDDRAAALRGKP